MTKFLHYVAEGGLNGRGIYDDQIHAEIPDPHIAFPDDDVWRNYLANQKRMRVDLVTKALVEFEPPEQPIADLRANAIKQLHINIAGLVDKFTDGVSPQELASWSTKAIEARGHLDGLPSQLIMAEAAQTGEEPDALAQAITERAEEYVLIIATVTGLRRSATGNINAATTSVEVQDALDAATDQLTQIAAATAQSQTSLVSEGGT